MEKVKELALLGVVLAALTVTPAALAGSSGSSPVGSWEIVADDLLLVRLVTYIGGPVGGPLTATLGTTPAHGAWKKTGRRTYSSTDVAFLFETGSPGPWKQVVHAEFELSQDGESLTGAITIELVDPESGEVVQDFPPITTTGTRITVEGSGSDSDDDSDSD